jgi:putative ABC transport system permease protein
MSRHLLSTTAALGSVLTGGVLFFVMPLRSIVIWTLGIVGALIGLAILLVLVATLLLSAVLLVVVLLQVVGVVRRVPLAYNIRNLIVRWKPTALTALAFTLVVGLMTVMLAFVNGMYKLTEASGAPGNVLVLQDGATDELFSDLGYGGGIRLLDNNPSIVKQDIEYDGKAQLEPLISWELYVVVNQPIPNAKPGGRQRRFVQVRGIEHPVRSSLVHNLPLYDGGAWFSGAGVRKAMDRPAENLIEAVLGEGMARELGADLGKKSLQIGDIFDLGPSRWIVTGIMKSAGSTFDSEVWAKRQLVGEKFGKNTATTAVLRTADADTAQQTATWLQANFKDPAVRAQTETDYYSSLNATNKQFLFSILFVVIIMAIGGVFGVMNTMFAVISQRTKDIGILRILGYARWQILVSFFLESLLLALLGGALGCALGYLANGVTASSTISGGQGGGKSIVLKLVVDWKILGAGLLFSLLMGCVGGLIPALSAMRLRPLESLR